LLTRPRHRIAHGRLTAVAPGGLGFYLCLFGLAARDAGVVLSCLGLFLGRRDLLQ
jgi:hypothetical protein